MKADGKVIKYGNNVDTDVIIPARYLNTSDPVELAKHCMEDLDKEFISKVKSGDIMVAGKNFGCGSSREHAPIAIKAACPNENCPVKPVIRFKLTANIMLIPISVILSCIYESIIPKSINTFPIK